MEGIFLLIKQKKWKGAYGTFGPIFSDKILPYYILHTVDGAHARAVYVQVRRSCARRQQRARNMPGRGRKMFAVYSSFRGGARAATEHAELIATVETRNLVGLALGCFRKYSEKKLYYYCSRTDC